MHGPESDRGQERRIWQDVMTQDMIRQLPDGHALILRGSLSPVIARLGIAWKDRAYKAARRAGNRHRPSYRPHPGCLPSARRPRRAGGWSPCQTWTPGPAGTGVATMPRPTRGADGDDRDDNRARGPDRRAAPARRAHPEAGRPGTPAGHRHPGGPRAYRLADPGRGRREGHHDRSRRGPHRPRRSGRRSSGPAEGARAEPAGYQPPPAPRFWKVGDSAHREAVGKLRGWVEDVYRPGYGHLAASLGDCWDQHPLCLYILDWLSELWSVLYLAPARTPPRWPGRPSGTPGCSRPRPGSCPGKPAAAAMPAPAGAPTGRPGAQP